jgi:hypothetical protein
MTAMPPPPLPPLSYPRNWNAQPASGTWTMPQSAASMVSPGGQDTWAHRGVQANRYQLQQSNPNIVVPEQDGPERYSSTLYETPYDQTQNMISTGTMTNPYTGEMFETFENQLPPPNTTKGSILKSQLTQANPKLLHAQGGYNSHNPPPRKKEQPGYVFNPVNPRGGSNPFGDAVYAPQISQRVHQMVSRDIFNNRDGDYSVERGMIGERPKNKFGLVPRLRFMPYIGAANELSKGEYMPAPANRPTDLRKREEFTGKWFNRKAHPVLAREVGPTCFVNGVEPITYSPMTTDRSGPMRADLEQNYIPAAHLEVGQIVNSQPLSKVRHSGGQTSRLAAGPSSGEQQQPTMPTDLSRTMNAGPLNHNIIGPVALANATSGVIIPNEISLRPTQKSQASFPIVGVDTGITSVPIMPTGDLRPTLKSQSGLPTVGVDTGIQSLPIIATERKLRSTLKSQSGLPTVGVDTGIQSLPIIATERKLRSTLKLQSGLPIVGIDPGIQSLPIVVADRRLRPEKQLVPNPTALASMPNVGVLISAKNLRPTLKNPRALPTGGDIRSIPNVGIIMSEANLRQTQKFTPTLPVGPICDSNFSAGIVIADTSLRATLKTAAMENPFRVGNSDAMAEQRRLTHDTLARQTQKGTFAALPAGPIQMAEDGSYIVIDKSGKKKTCRTKQEAQTYQMGVEGKDMAQSLIKPLVSSIQHRGKKATYYFPALSMTPEAANGTSARIVQPLLRQRGWSLEETPNRQMLPDAPSTMGQYTRTPIGESTRVPMRSFTDAIDLCDEEQDI